MCLIICNRQLLILFHTFLNTFLLVQVDSLFKYIIFYMKHCLYSNKNEEMNKRREILFSWTQTNLPCLLDMWF